jgi:glycerate kinase
VRVLIAPDCFGGTLSAAEAADAIAAGWRAAAPGDVLDLLPLSDGGPGFVSVLADALGPAAGGQLLAVTVSDPLGRQVPAQILLASDGTAYVESAQACGLHLVAPADRSPETADTRGVGELLAAAAQTGAARVVVGLGGSATTDGGRGAWEVLDGTWPSSVELIAATDVDAPLLGHEGAAQVFAPQKGADPDAVERLEERLAAWADVVEAAVGRSVRSRGGAGAAGGLGFVLLAWGAVREPGVSVVAARLGLAERIVGAGLALTGEGRYDSTSVRGKVPRGVAHAAQAAGVPCVVLAGQSQVGAREARSHGVDAVYAMAELAGSVAGAVAEPGRWLSALATKVARQWSPAAV